MDCLYIDVCIKIASVCTCVCGVFTRAFETTGVGGEHMSEGVRKRVSLGVCVFTCFVWLCYCFYRILFAWWFCSFLLRCIFLYFARFCTYVKFVFFFFRFLHIFSRLPDRTTIWTVFVCIFNATLSMRIIFVMYYDSLDFVCRFLQKKI